MARIVVGIDGSDGSERALGFALEEAEMREATLEVVHVCGVREGGVTGSVAYELGLPSGGLSGSLTGQEHDLHEDFHRRARETGERLIERMIGEFDTDGVTIEQTLLIDRRPARAIIELVNSDDDVILLVVGSRGHGELTGLVLGSVSQACVAHASVPVVVVHRN